MPKSKTEAMKQKNESGLNVKSSTLRLIVLSSLAVLFLIIANSAVWINKSVFNTQNFSEITTKSLLSESSRGAIADEIVQQALSDRPIINSAVQEPASKFISGLLATTQAESAVSRAASRLQIAVTSEYKENIEIDLSSIKQTAAKLIDLAGQDRESTNIDNIPSKITLVDVSKIPEFYKLGTLFMWLGPIALVIGLLLLAEPHLRAKRLRLELLLGQGFIVLAGYLLGLLIGPLFRPPVLSQFNNVNLRLVAENIYNNFVASFNSQLRFMLVLGLIMIAVPIVDKIYRTIKKRYKD